MANCENANPVYPKLVKTSKIKKATVPVVLYGHMRTVGISIQNPAHWLSSPDDMKMQTPSLNQDSFTTVKSYGKKTIQMCMCVVR